MAPVIAQQHPPELQMIRVLPNLGRCEDANVITATKERIPAFGGGIAA